MAAGGGKAETRGKNVCHDMIIWKNLIETELRTAAEWEANWGFLKEPRKLPRSMTDQAFNKNASMSTPSLASAGRAMLRTRDEGPPGSAGSDFGDDRYRALQSRSRLPRERYIHPATTAQEIGWRTSIERFGVSHHGIKRDPGLWPDM